ncbi:Sip1p-Gal83p family protein [Scheffersomyces xylosifermentans]|uniref:Sip1p-Gal83p family protein n=1 Tax=Scheffersomyces xylosifermentans TaxID=1304137 RepID=UPI00315CDE69
MGNNASATASASSRKSAAAQIHQQPSDSRRSTSSRHTIKADASLDEEFSDLILHQVKRDDSIGNTFSQQPANTLSGTTSSSSAVAAADTANSSGDHNYPVPYIQFSNDLIEDEYNELNDGLLDQEPEVSRNILPTNSDEENDHDPSRMETSSSSSGLNSDDANSTTKNKSQINNDDHMEVDQDSFGNRFDISKARAEHTPTPDLAKVDFTKIATQSPQNTVEVRVDESYVHSTNKKRQNRSMNSSTNNITAVLIPVEIKWVNTNKDFVISKISIIGSFSNWRDSIALSQSPFHPNEYITTLNLPLGVHKLLYIINNEYRVSDQLPTATDSEGIFFNWFEVIDEAHLFNHSLNQPNHVGASTDYDANIISPPTYYHNKSTSSASVSQSMNQQPQTAGKYEVDRINKKSNSFLAKISKESSNFEHVEYVEDDMKDIKMHDEMQQNSENYPYGKAQDGSVNDSSHYVPYNFSTSNSSLRGHEFENSKGLEYSSEIPEMFVNYDYFKNKSPNYELPEPPQLPAHLNNVLLNKISQATSSHNSANQVNTTIPQVPTNPPSHHHGGSKPPSAGLLDSASSYGSSSQYNHKRPPLRRADSSYYASNKEAYHLSIPNHVILNHLMTTSIRNDVLTVACITRYSGKFVTQIMHSPSDKS